MPLDFAGSMTAATAGNEVLERGPLAASGRIKRITPFAAVFALVLAATGLDSDGHRIVLGLVSMSGILVIVGAVAIPWARISRFLQTLLPFGALLLLALGATADGGPDSHLAIVMIVPLIWLAIYERMRPLVVALIVVALWLGVFVALEPTQEHVLYAVVYGAVMGGLLPPVRRLVTEQRELAGTLAVMVELDVLTGLSNRRGLERRAREVIQSRRPSGLGMLFVDVDHFKGVNDLLGHDAGDSLLVQLGQRLRSAARAGDFVCRVGGDEFVILVHGDETATASVAERIDQEIRSVPYRVGGELVSVSASVGVSHTAEPVLDISALLSRADSAMYRAKAVRRRLP